MMKIINGMLYNTDTAHAVGGCTNGEMPGELGYESDILYRTPRGKYFLHRQSVGWLDDDSDKAVGFIDELLPFCCDGHAMRWAETHLAIPAYIDEFGEPEIA